MVSFLDAVASCVFDDVRDATCVVRLLPTTFSRPGFQDEANSIMVLRLSAVWVLPGQVFFFSL